MIPSTGAVIWCCRAPYAQPPPLVPPAPLFKIEQIEVKPMEMPLSRIFDLDFTK